MTIRSDMLRAIELIAHRDGRDAFLRGVDLDECPHTAAVDPDYRRAWRRAWLQASQKEQRALDDERRQKDAEA